MGNCFNLGMTRQQRLRSDGERIAVRVMKKVHDAPYPDHYMPITVKAAGSHDRPSNKELDDIKDHVNSLIPKSVAAVHELTTQPYKYVDGDFANTYDGDFVPYLCTGFLTCGIGFFVVPFIYDLISKWRPSAYYRVYYDYFPK